MTAKSNSCAWWHAPRPVSIDPLEAVRITAQCLEDGQIVPAAAAALVASAFRRYLAGELDISRNMGLRPRRGGRHETPLAIERISQRNATIKLLVDLQDGPVTKRCDAVAQMLKEPPIESRVTEADVFGYLLGLHRDFAGELPTSMRQIFRIVDGK